MAPGTGELVWVLHHPTNECTHSPPPAVGKQAQLPLPVQKSEAEWFGAGLCLRRPLFEGEAPPVGKTADQLKPGDTSSSSGEAVKSKATRRPNRPQGSWSSHWDYFCCARNKWFDDGHAHHHVALGVVDSAGQVVDAWLLVQGWEGGGTKLSPPLEVITVERMVTRELQPWSEGQRWMIRWVEVHDDA